MTLDHHATTESTDEVSAAAGAGVGAGGGVTERVVGCLAGAFAALPRSADGGGDLHAAIAQRWLMLQLHDNVAATAAAANAANAAAAASHHSSTTDTATSVDKVAKGLRTSMNTGTDAKAEAKAVTVPVVSKKGSASSLVPSLRAEAYQRWLLQRRTRLQFQQLEEAEAQEEQGG